MSLIFSNFTLSTNTPGTKVKLFTFAVYSDGYGVNVRKPITTGMSFRMTDVMTKLWHLAT